jgi:hypothetical protein
VRTLNFMRDHRWQTLEVERSERQKKNGKASQNKENIAIRKLY